jgi:DHA2 family methylenomycin A resistance protein-like MFS transporter
MPAASHPSRSAARWTLIATSFGLGMALLDVTAVNVAVPSIQASLHTDVRGLSWVIDGYTLAFASLLLLAGGLGDRLGAKRVFTAGLVIFTLASALCGAAPGLGTLILARIVQGVGAALFMPSSLAILRQACPDGKERAQAIGIWSALTAVAGACGPLFGGLLISGFGWRSIFLLNVPVGVVAVAMALRFVGSSAGSARRGFDLPAQLTGAAALALFTWALIERSARGWGSPVILIALLAALAGLRAFVALERRNADPILPLVLFANRTFSATAAAALLYAGAFFGSVLVFSLYFQRVRGDSPAAPGLHIAAITARGRVQCEPADRHRARRRDLCLPLPRRRRLGPVRGAHLAYLRGRALSARVGAGGARGARLEDGAARAPSLEIDVPDVECL